MVLAAHTQKPSLLVEKVRILSYRVISKAKNGIEGDPFLLLTAASPSSSMVNTSSQIILKHDAFHRTDMRIAEGLIDESVFAVQEAVLHYLGVWLEEYTAPKPQRL